MSQLSIDNQPLVVRPATLEQIIQLRHDVIIVGTGHRPDTFDGDDDSQAHHFGAFVGERVLGCVSYLPELYDGESAYRLRGMAVHGDYQRRGIGRAMAIESQRQLMALTPIRLLWCNAREQAVRFYESLGWTVTSEPFDVEGVCVHRRMIKRLT